MKRPDGGPGINRNMSAGELPVSEKTASLKQESKLLARHSIVYGAGNFLNRFAGFLLIPFYTRFLTTADYGSLELVGLTTELIGIVLSVRLSRAVYRFYFEYDELRERNAVVSTAIVAFGSIGLAGLALVSIANPFLAEHILDGRQYASYFFISFASLWFQTVVGIGQYYLMAVQRSRTYVQNSFAMVLVTILCNIYLVAALKLGVKGILLGNLAGAVAGFFIVILPILRTVGFRISREALRGMLRYGLPLIPGAIANFCVLVSDRFFVKYFVSLSATGLYSLGYKFGVLPDSFVTVPFFQTWSARRMELMRDPGAEEKMGKIVTHFLVVLTFVGMTTSALIGDVLKIMADQSYWPAAQYVPVITLGIIIYGTFNPFLIPIMVEKKTHFLSYIDIANGIINVGLNFLLIPRFGAWGACYASLLAYTGRVAMTYWIGNRIRPIYFEFRRFLHMLVAGAITYYAAVSLPVTSPWIGLPLRSLVLLLYPAILYFTAFFSQDEVSLALSFLGSLKSKAHGRLVFLRSR